MFIEINRPDTRAPLDSQIQAAADIRPRCREIALKGKLYTADDSICAGEDFSELINLRYCDIGLDAVPGMTKINDNVIGTYLKVRSAFHFRKSEPEESHILAQGWNTGETLSAVIQNTSVIPATGDFSATELWADTPGASIGRFSPAPGGHVAYCNGKEACLWGGDEYRVGSFLNHDPGGSFSYDWTEQVRNTLSDIENVAVMSPDAAGIDANTVLMIDFNDDVADHSPVSAHTPVATDITYSSTAGTYKFIKSGVFNGSSSKIVISENSDFDFSGGVFTIDAQLRVTSLSAKNPIYYQQTDANNYFDFHINTDGSLHLSIFAASSEVLGTAGLSTAAGTIVANTMYHVMLVENGNDWYIFVEGKLKAYMADASRAAAYTGATPVGDVHIGTDNTAYYVGNMDEFRVSVSARNTSQFDPPSAAYTTSTYRVTFYIGATRPLQGVNLYMGTVNTATSTSSMDHWTGSWTALAITDGTSSGTVSLSKDGLISFPSTVATAKTKMVKGMLLYWYRLTIAAADAACSIYHVTLDAPFQKIRDVWDGVNSLLQAAHLYKTNYEEYTLNVQENDYDSSDTATFVELDSITSANHMVFGFLSQQCGVSLSIAGGKANTTAGTLANVYYWNGLTWARCSNVDDGTSVGNISLSQSGTITWESPAEGLEFKKDIGREFPLYYYKIVWTALDGTTTVTFSADVQVYFARGIPAPIHLYDFDFPYMGGDRLWLIKGNTATCSAMNSPDIYNGGDTFKVPFGDDRDLTSACELYCQFGANLYSINVFTKMTETWIIYMDGNGAWNKFRVSGGIGCAAKETMRTANIVPEVAGQNGTIAIWQGTNGIYAFDGRVLTPLHGDIKNYFDRRKLECINLSLISKSTGWFNDDETRYHWSFASGSTSTNCNKEFVYDLLKKKWFEVDRTTGKFIQLGFSVESVSGNKYPYGFIDSGYMERLDYGKTMDGVAIPHSFALGDLALYDGHVYIETTMRGVGLAVVANETSFEKITVSHAGDTADKEGYSLMTPRSSTGRVAQLIAINFSEKTGPFVYHKIGMSITTNDEDYGFRPKFVYIYYDPIKERGI